MKRLAAIAILLAACRAPRPTVVFESGLGDDSGPWRGVAARVKEFAPVYTYDRAGLGTSPPATTPRTPKNISRELHERLTRDHIAPPYIVVSHSAGAWYALQFAADYRDDVAGLIMVDPTPFDFFEHSSAVMSPSERATFEEKMRDYAARAPPGRRAEWDARTAAASEASLAVTRRDLPVTIITGGAASPDKSEQIRTWWNERHESWARQWPRGRHVVADSGHYVQLEKPEVVVAEIVRIAELLRSRSAPSPAR
jgi:pimeloyl-ACP methyl ester carboxylesterase